ncbi:unnamed protein product [Paramecium pentaurelia]|uniref:Uncharacterized protein n=1 Tax=Paramecium pentaurelia TaxID=43138 RepID=A0A8S1X9Z8_9CILI|nr:unnamed protein product [Paramecium pentaurelia]
MILQIKNFIQKIGKKFTFIKQREYIHKDETLYNEIVKDKKFAAVFDESELEVMSFYIIMLSFLRNSITLLQNQLNFKLRNFKEQDQLDGVEECAILFLIYLVLYMEICFQEISNFQNSIFYLNQFNLKQLVEEKYTNLTKKQFLQISQKINSLQLI